jgi:hypothetical protein
MESSNESQDHQDVEAENDDITSNSSNEQDVYAANDDDESSCDNENDSVDDVEFKSFRDQDDMITDDDIERMMMTVKADRGLQGNCGVNYKFAVGDTYWCKDMQLGYNTACVVESAKLHLCCVERDGCEDIDDMKAWRF